MPYTHRYSLVHSYQVWGWVAAYLPLSFLLQHVSLGPFLAKGKCWAPNPRQALHSLVILGASCFRFCNTASWRTTYWNLSLWQTQAHHRLMVRDRRNCA